MRVLIAGVAFAIGAIVAVGSQHALREEAPVSLTEADVERVVVEMFSEKPQVVVDALKAYQANEERATQERQKEQLASSQGELNAKDGDPFIGNPDASVTLVEFFDYRCGYCKRVTNDVMALVKEDDDLKIVFKEFPILGPDSVVAARVSLGIHKTSPELYSAFHEKLMKMPGRISKDAALNLAAELGADRTAVETAMETPAVESRISDNRALAEKLGIRGTPAFVVGDRLVPGAIGKESLQKLISEARKPS